MSNDRILVRRVLRGDASAFRTLFDHLFPRLYRFALARVDGDSDLAGEMVQQTFRKAIEKLHTYRGEAALYAWFCQICRNTIIDWQRAHQRERSVLVPFEDLNNVRAVLEALAAPVRDRPEVALWQRDMRRLVQATVDGLPSHYGDALEWKYIDGLTVAEIAERLDLKLKAVESLLTRARRAFRLAINEMFDEEITLTPPESLS